ncbi:Heat shock factor protein [Smittium culicis]|uniref:Heat shock factor protein n=1 Tax=Smittium culicis TaxID=133412 RepID=A0A1R1XUY1_9FUNG|nr:Heat shock factor protein [Smittium culicis]OMJ18495.1 Heat shock factor protein [Smittium culicis]
MLEQSSNVNQRIRVTGFLNKLYCLVEEPSTDGFIRWSENGESFFVYKHEEFAKEILPKYFKHSNLSSFVRQLNMYGFHKVPHLQQGALITDETSTESWEFSNTYFQKNQPDLLHFVTRNTRSRNSKGEYSDQGSESHKLISMKSSVKPEKDRNISQKLDKVLKEIETIKGHQMTISSEIKKLKQENRVLWSEAASTSNRSLKQQHGIEKIMKFLATVFTYEKAKNDVFNKGHLLLADKSTDFYKVNNSSPPFDNPLYSALNSPVPPQDFNKIFASTPPSQEDKKNLSDKNLDYIRSRRNLFDSIDESDSCIEKDSINNKLLNKNKIAPIIKNESSPTTKQKDYQDLLEFEAENNTAGSNIKSSIVQIPSPQPVVTESPEDINQKTPIKQLKSIENNDESVDNSLDVHKKIYNSLKGEKNLDILKYVQLHSDILNHNIEILSKLTSPKSPKALGQAPILDESKSNNKLIRSPKNNPQSLLEWNNANKITNRNTYPSNNNESQSIPNPIPNNNSSTDNPVQLLISALSSCTPEQLDIFVKLFTMLENSGNSLPLLAQQLDSSNRNNNPILSQLISNPGNIKQIPANQPNTAITASPYKKNSVLNNYNYLAEILSKIGNNQPKLPEIPNQALSNNTIVQNHDLTNGMNFILPNNYSSQLKPEAQSFDYINPQLPEYSQLQNPQNDFNFNMDGNDHELSELKKYLLANNALNYDHHRLLTGDLSLLNNPNMNNIDNKNGKQTASHNSNESNVNSELSDLLLQNGNSDLFSSFQNQQNPVDNQQFNWNLNMPKLPDDEKSPFDDKNPPIAPKINFKNNNIHENSDLHSFNFQDSLPDLKASNNNLPKGNKQLVDNFDFINSYGLGPNSNNIPIINSSIPSSNIPTDSNIPNPQIPQKIQAQGLNEQQQYQQHQFGIQPTETQETNSQNFFNKNPLLTQNQLNLLTNPSKSSSKNDNVFYNQLPAHENVSINGRPGVELNSQSMQQSAENFFNDFENFINSSNRTAPLQQEPKPHNNNDFGTMTNNNNNTSGNTSPVNSPIDNISPITALDSDSSNKLTNNNPNKRPSSTNLQDQPAFKTQRM